MNDFTGEGIIRLLFTEKPFDDESFIGYIMRLANLNEIPELQWILKLAGLSKLYDYHYKFNCDFKVDPQRLSVLTGTTAENLKNLLYLHEHGRTRNIIGNINVFGQPILHHFVRREKPKICPPCLAEQNYCRKIWELSPITACPHHQCLLIDHCPNCNRKINWTRPALNICHCEFDFRKSSIVLLPRGELRFTTYLFQDFGLIAFSKEEIFEYPLNNLAGNDLLKLLFFAAAHFAEMPDYSGTSISKYKNNAEIHKYLNQAVEVFDDWADSYHHFIRLWKKQQLKYFINCKQLYMSKVELPRKWSDYELFNQILHQVLYEEQFSFMHEEFALFLENLPEDDVFRDSFFD